jgi:undecaprenyl-diphosphatase
VYFQTQGWDLTLFRLVNGQWRAPALDVLAPVVSEGRLLWALSALLVGWLWLRARRQGSSSWAPLLLGAALLASASLADSSTGLFKDAVGRVRPLNALPNVHYMEDGEWRVRPPEFASSSERGNSYPSGHAANSMAVAVALIAFSPRLYPRAFLAASKARWLALLLPLSVGWSRIYLGKHYPTDVLGGYGVGVVAGLLIWTVLTVLAGKKKRGLPL